MSESNTEQREVIHEYRCQDFRSVVYKDEIIYRKDPEKKVAHIILNRPERLNSNTVAGLDYMIKLIKAAEEDDEVKIIVFEGMGPCFGTGDDANELGFYIGFSSGKSPEQNKKPSQRRRFYPDRNLVFGPSGIEQTIMRCLKVTVLKVHSYCYGIHTHMAAYADIVIASDDALFGNPAWRYLGPMFNFSALLDVIGIKKLKDWMLTGRPMTAAEAEQCGLITKMVKREDLDRAVQEYIDAISLVPMDGIAIGKQMIETCLDARGTGVGASNAIAAHALLTGLKFEEGEWNFMKSRRDKGLTQALEERDRMLAPQFRMGKARKE